MSDSLNWLENPLARALLEAMGKGNKNEFIGLDARVPGGGYLISRARGAAHRFAARAARRRDYAQQQTMRLIRSSARV